MIAMRLIARQGCHGLQGSAGKDVVEAYSDPAKREAKYQAFEIKSGPLCQVEETWWIPVFWDKQWLCKSERSGHRADPHHSAPVQRKRDV